MRMLVGLGMAVSMLVTGSMGVVGVRSDVMGLLNWHAAVLCHQLFAAPAGTLDVVVMLHVRRRHRCGDVDVRTISDAHAHHCR